MKLFSLVGVLLFLMSGSVHSRPVIILNVLGAPPLNDSEQNGFLDHVASEAFRRIGYDLKTVLLPAERGLRNANMGIEDGEISRISGLQKIYGNLIQVPESIMDWQFVAIGAGELDTSLQWASLRGKTVGIINGWKILEENVAPLAKVTKVSQPHKLFMLLRYKRVQYIVFERWSGTQYLQEFHIKSASIKLPPLAIRRMYIYLNKKHKKLVTNLAGALRSVKSDGTYQRLKKRYLDQVKNTGISDGK